MLGGVDTLKKMVEREQGGLEKPRITIKVFLNTYGG
jgi:hypothetical protein